MCAFLCPNIRLRALVGQSLLGAFNRMMEGIQHMCGCVPTRCGVAVRLHACMCLLGRAWLLVHSAADLLHTCQRQLPGVKCMVTPFASTATYVSCGLASTSLCVADRKSAMPLLPELVFTAKAMPPHAHSHSGHGQASALCKGIRWARLVNIAV